MLNQDDRFFTMPQHPGVSVPIPSLRLCNVLPSLADIVQQGGSQHSVLIALCEPFCLAQLHCSLCHIEGVDQQTARYVQVMICAGRAVEKANFVKHSPHHHATRSLPDRLNKHLLVLFFRGIYALSFHAVFLRNQALPRGLAGRSAGPIALKSSGLISWVGCSNA